MVTNVEHEPNAAVDGIYVRALLPPLPLQRHRAAG
jgi:hypothetical protein